jgi:hypothetical protein
MERISWMYSNQSKRRNLRQVFVYLKECYTVMNAALVGQKYEPKIRISVDRRGIPKIIPPKLRDWLMDDTALFTGDPRGLKNTRIQCIESGDSDIARYPDGRVPAWFDSVYHRIDLNSKQNLQRRVVFVAVQTLLSIHRTFKWWPDVDLSTVLKPFSGSRQFLDNRLLWGRAKVALLGLSEFKDLTHNQKALKALDVGPAYPFVSESSGPNTNTAHWGCIEDAIALAIRPYYLDRVIRWLWRYKSYQTLMFFLGTLIFSIPFFIYCLLRYRLFSISLLTGRFKLNRLAVVRNVSGKSRIVGITNYWIQTALRPLHKAIFRFLRGIKQDGTFDQHRPIKDLVGRRKSDAMYYSFDLTAATDRLPIDLQEYVLSLFIGERNARLWKEILSMPFEYEGIEHYYAVGQPMGAYSSWAMLALTHHMIVQAAANVHGGCKPFGDYAVLGDDVVITGDPVNMSRPGKDDTVARYYHDIMTSLGVEISLGKSIVSNNYIEFAKRLFDTNLRDWSPVGPGLILNLVRDRNLLGLFLSELVERSLMEIHTVIELLAATRRLTTDGIAGFSLWVMFGPRGLVNTNFHVAFLDGMRKLSKNTNIPEGSLDYLCYLALCTMVNRKFFSQHYSAIRCMREFPVFLWKRARAGHGWLEAALYFLAMMFTPTPGLVFSNLIEKTKWVSERPDWRGPKDMPLLIEYLREFHVERLGALSRRERTDLTKAYRELSSTMSSIFKANPRPFLGSAEVGPGGISNVFDD